MTSDPIVRVSGLSKAFRIPSVRRDTVREHALHLFRPRRFERLVVLDDISFDVARGEALGIMGRNGCGKSTLLRMICGVYQPDAGLVETGAPVTPILELGVGWNGELDAVDNVYLIGTVMGMTLDRIRRRMDAMLAFAELRRFANQKLKHFSSGMAARLGYAVAFEAVQDVLVLDEMFAVGDAGFRAKCEARYQELRQAGTTILMVSHNATIISTFCDRALLIDGGRIVADGPATRVANDYSSLLA